MIGNPDFSGDTLDLRLREDDKVVNYDKMLEMKSAKKKGTQRDNVHGRLMRRLHEIPHLSRNPSERVDFLFARTDVGERKVTLGDLFSDEIDALIVHVGAVTKVTEPFLGFCLGLVLSHVFYPCIGLK